MQSLKEISDIFKQYGEDMEKSTKIYSFLAIHVADDPELIDLVFKNNKNKQLPPLILFGPVHYLLLKGIKHPLRDFYPTIVGDKAKDMIGNYNIFHDFCLAHSKEIIELMQTKIVQTNEVNRSTVLFTGFNWIIDEQHKSELSLIELGCSAGLNLCWDKFCYQFEDKLVGNGGCELILSCEVRGPFRPNFDFTSIRIKDRVGIDLNPLNISSEEDSLWLQSLIWPERLERLINLQKAIKISKNYPKKLIKGHGSSKLGEVLNIIDKETVVVVYQSFAFYLFSDKEKEKIKNILLDSSRLRPIYLLSMEWEGINGKRTFLKVDSFINGKQESFTLAESHFHGEWIKWLINSKN